MKKYIAIPLILILSGLIATFVGFLGDVFLKSSHPLKYNELVTKYSAENNVPEPIVYAVIKTESKFKADAVSYKGAIGLMQITPDTFEWLCSKTGETATESLLYDPEINIRYGTYYLSYLHGKYKNWETVYAAYNAGPGNVDTWLSSEEYGKYGRLIDIPFEETENYVKKVKKAAENYEKLYFSDSRAITESAPLVDNNAE